MTEESDININKAKPWANSAVPGCYDVQSVMTHELGHVLGLSDKYDEWASEWTMYGYGEMNSISKRTITLIDFMQAVELNESND